MKKFLILGLLLIASAAPGQTTAVSPSAAAEGEDPNEIICVTIRSTGSRLTRSRRCLTRAEWAQHRQNNRAMVDEAQLRQFNPGDRSPGTMADSNGRYLPADRGSVPR